MMAISGSTESSLYSFETVDNASFRYEAVQCWATLPEGQNFGMVVALQAYGGRIYAFQRAEPSVLVFDGDGQLLDAWGPRTDFAHGLFVDDGGVYMTDRNASTCLIYTHDGKPVQMLGRRNAHSDTGALEWGGAVLRTAGPFNGPTQLVRSPSGELVVADGYRNARIHWFSTEGELRASWGEYGQEDGQFRVPHGLLATEDRIYVCDRGNDRVQVLTPDGAFLSEWTDFHLPQAIDMGVDGNLYVSDSAGAATVEVGLRHPDLVEGGMARVSVMSETGEVLASVANRSIGHGFCVDEDGSMYTALHTGEGIDKLRRI
jgi:DNA-binding beta-propeller fold protein YncE